MKNYNRVLVVAAEQQEIDAAKAGVRAFYGDANAVDYLLTGVGITATTYHLLKRIMEARAEGNPYDIILEVGIAGSYDLAKFPDGSVVLVDKEYFADLGFETPFGFETLFDSYLPADTFPFVGGALLRYKFNEKEEGILTSLFPGGTGLSVQTITGSKEKVEMLRKKFNPDVEGMEGAALYYVAHKERVPFMQLRSVSNEVGCSDSSKWSTSLALSNLSKAVRRLCEDFL